MNDLAEAKRLTLAAALVLAQTGRGHSTMLQICSTACPAAGADVNTRSRSGNTALIIAAATSHSGAVIKELLRRGADVSARNLDGDEALIYAVR